MTSVRRETGAVVNMGENGGAAPVRSRASTAWFLVLLQYNTQLPHCLLDLENCLRASKLTSKWASSVLLNNEHRFRTVIHVVILSCGLDGWRPCTLKRGWVGGKGSEHWCHRIVAVYEAFGWISTEKVYSRRVRQSRCRHERLNFGQVWHQRRNGTDLTWLYGRCRSWELLRCWWRILWKRGKKAPNPVASLCNSRPAYIYDEHFSLDWSNAGRRNDRRLYISEFRADKSATARRTSEFSVEAKEWSNNLASKTVLKTEA